jgi:glycosyltransferase involved in cell wall biosynthesis
VKIAFCINTAWNIYNFRRILIEEFILRGHEVHCIAPPDDYVGKLKDLGCEFHEIKLRSKGSNPFQDLRFGIELSNTLKRIKADILLSYTIKPNIYGTLFQSFHKVPIIANVSGLGTIFIRKNLTSLLAKTLYRIALRKAQVIFFQNKDDQELFEELGLIKPNKSQLIPGSGIDLSRFPPTQKSNDPEKPFIFLMLSRVLFDKGLREYISAARELTNSGKNYRFLLCGKIEEDAKLGPSISELEKLTQGSGVEYLGFSDDPAEVIGNCDCMVLPSYREGLPKSLLEGASMEKPLIASDVPGCQEVVFDGVNGFLCRPLSGTDLANTMEKMAKLDYEIRKGWGKKSRELIRERFSKEIIIEKYCSIVDQIVNKPNGNSKDQT